MDDDLVFGEKPAAKPRKARAPKPKFDTTFPSKKADKARDSGWPIIVIDEVIGQPNFEVVGVNGKHYRIMRSVEVPVPPEVVSVLKDAIEEYIIQTRNPGTGLIETRTMKRSAIPWRVVGYVP